MNIADTVPKIRKYIPVKRECINKQDIVLREFRDYSTGQLREIYGLHQRGATERL
ncbi:MULTISPECIES: hypothetical protein [Symbiopectobacterium]|uniref:hypothetical protein n=1 Tax=Symbiopectobacterium TaxID=801 RepID=UPI0020798735|nr:MULTISPECIES: hypothetical protein [Symbiopectobacterium]MBT9428586.1 hypothetical protein [Candidatus Symbiopectobacterium endolongispinus]